MLAIINFFPICFREFRGTIFQAALRGYTYVHRQSSMLGVSYLCSVYVN